MVKYIILVSIFFSALACGQHETTNKTGKPRVQFAETEFDFGNVIMGEKVSHRFTFKNIGGKDLLIDNVISSCGCTVVSYDKKPIATGDESFIEVSFDSEGYRGLQMKQVEVYSNCDSSKNTLKLWAKMVEPKE